MAGIRDIESGKIYIGVEEPVKLDQAAETLNGDKPFDGTLVATGPTFLGAHKGGFAKATLNVGTALGDWSPGVDGRAVQVEGDVEIIGEKAENAVVVDGNSHVTGNISTGGDLSVGGFASWSGSIVATTKLFDIPHPNKEGHRLAHACLEGPEHSVYFRGKVRNRTTIQLPKYWKGLVDYTTITVNLTPIGAHQNVIVKRVDESKIYLQAQGGMPINCYFHVYGTRQDVGRLEVEYEGESFKDSPNNS